MQYLQGEIKTLKGSLTQAQLASADSNKENARLVGELAQAERLLHDAKAELRTLQGVQAELGTAQQQVDRLGRRVVELESHLAEQQKRTQTLEATRTADQAQIQELRIELGAARAAAEAQSQLTDKIQAWLQPGQLFAPESFRLMSYLTTVHTERSALSKLTAEALLKDAATPMATDKPTTASTKLSKKEQDIQKRLKATLQNAKRLGY